MQTLDILKLHPAPRSDNFSFKKALIPFQRNGRQLLGQEEVVALHISVSIGQADESIFRYLESWTDLLSDSSYVNFHCLVHFKYF